MTYVINKSVQSHYSDRGSSFLGFLFLIQSSSEFRKKLKEIRNLHPKSSHVCSAYRIINSNSIEEKGSDDGEPRGSAGFPILNELKRVDVVNAAIFVVRYYGGTKLGIPGLIHAYSEVVRLALSVSDLSDWISKKKYIINHSYQDIDSLDFFIKKYKGKLLNRTFDLFVQSIVEISDASIHDFKNVIASKLPNIDTFLDLE